MLQVEGPRFECLLSTVRLLGVSCGILGVVECAWPQPLRRAPFRLFHKCGHGGTSNGARPLRPQVYCRWRSGDVGLGMVGARDGEERRDMSGDVGCVCFGSASGFNGCVQVSVQHDGMAVANVFTRM